MPVPILEAAAPDLADVGLVLDAGGARPDDADDRDAIEFDVTIDQRTTRFTARVNRHVTPSTAGLAHARLTHAGGADVVLLAEYVTVETADVLRRLGQQFIDSAGNAYLRTEGLLVWHVGRPRRSRPPADGHATPALVRTQFAVLARPALIGRPFRAIAQASRTSVGSVQTAVRQLDERGHIATRGTERTLVDRARLLDDWLPLYLRILRPKLLLDRFAGEPADWWTSEQADPDEVQWGGEAAAFRLDGYLRPGLATLYADELPRAFIRAHRLQRVRHDGERVGVEVRQRFWDVAGVPSDPPDVVPPVLVYADLLAASDARSVEAAGRIREGHLARLLDEE
jgi:hypothetical protein